jgi:GNAT superfamily N-acetyltransferase
MNSTSNMIDPFPILETRDSREIDEICRFRAEVWSAIPGTRPDAFPLGHWRDPFDDWARHWIVRSEDGRLVAAARLTIHDGVEQMIEPREYLRYGLKADGQIAAPDRVVVAHGWRNRGLAAKLLEVQERAGRDANAVCAARQASPGMVRLIQPRGWRILGPASRDPRFPSTCFSVAMLIYVPEQVQFSSPRRRESA